MYPSPISSFSSPVTSEYVISAPTSGAHAIFSSSNNFRSSVPSSRAREPIYPDPIKRSVMESEEGREEGASAEPLPYRHSLLPPRSFTHPPSLSYQMTYAIQYAESMEPRTIYSSPTHLIVPSHSLSSLPTLMSTTPKHIQHQTSFVRSSLYVGPQIAKSDSLTAQQGTFFEPSSTRRHFRAASGTRIHSLDKREKIWRDSRVEGMSGAKKPSRLILAMRINMTRWIREVSLCTSNLLHSVLTLDEHSGRRNRNISK